jgi:hypothetical protein
MAMAMGISLVVPVQDPIVENNDAYAVIADRIQYLVGQSLQSGLQVCLEVGVKIRYL